MAISRRIVHSQLATLTNSRLEVWSPCSIGLPYIFSKLSAECRVFHRGFASCTSYKSKAVLWRSRAILKFQYPRKPVKPMMVAVNVRHPGVVEAIRSYQKGKFLSSFLL
ncbi:PREDICTED: uncharacterized protein LOC109187270 isoform X2 [Ipomoea nil]|uniref:uncharacterized protein LOC109187270 isoform X2 n=1 Tax=Ipomoea nil TaxID=35883 RepID=UPI00090099A3|nr:PREDICTED: uncharacterized protein LOC109187270 isoform X2 [Ipomoea nil]